MSEARAIAPRVTVLPATRNRFTTAPIASVQKRRVAAYARVSTDSDEQLTSYEEQVDHYAPVSYTHLDVYKRQELAYFSDNKLYVTRL